jgi:hypothetical protein
MRPDDDLDSTLTRIGADAGPPIDPVFANRLDGALRVAHAEQLTERDRRSIWIPVTAGLSAVGALIVGVMILVASVNGAANDEVVMTAATGTDVVIPGELVMDGTPGLRLPDGTRISVGPNGEAVVDGVVLGPGAEAVVIGGRLEVVDVDPVDSADADRASPPSPSLTTAPPVTSRPDDAAPGTDPPTNGSTTSSIGRPDTDAARSDGAGDDGVPGRSTTVPATSTTGDRQTTSPTGATSSTRPGSNSTTAPTSSTVVSTTTAAPRPASLVVTATALPRGRVLLEWMVHNLDPAAGPLAGFRVEAAVGDRVSTLVVIRSPSARSATIERLAATDATFRIEAIDNVGHVLLASEAVAQPAP